MCPHHSMGVHGYNKSSYATEYSDAMLTWQTTGRDAEFPEVFLWTQQEKLLPWRGSSNVMLPGFQSRIGSHSEWHATWKPDSVSHTVHQDKRVFQQIDHDSGGTFRVNGSFRILSFGRPERTALQQSRCIRKKEWTIIAIAELNNRFCSMTLIRCIW